MGSWIERVNPGSSNVYYGSLIPPNIYCRSHSCYSPIVGNTWNADECCIRMLMMMISTMLLFIYYLIIIILHLIIIVYFNELWYLEINLITYLFFYKRRWSLKKLVSPKQIKGISARRHLFLWLYCQSLLKWLIKLCNLRNRLIQLFALECYDQFAILQWRLIGEIDRFGMC